MLARISARRPFRTGTHPLVVHGVDRVQLPTLLADGPRRVQSLVLNTSNPPELAQRMAISPAPVRAPALRPPWPTTGAPGCVAFQTLMVVDAPPGGGPKLHRHPYEEVIIVQEGTATFTAGDETVEVNGGQVVVVPAGVAHKFVNSGQERLRQVDIHASERFVTEWLEN